MKTCGLFPALTAAFSVVSAFPASAVIVAGGSGGGNNSNNTTQAQLESELGTVFPIYENVVQYSDSTGIYLGYDPVTKDVWVLTARHITANGTAGATITIDGLVYDRQADGDGYGILVGGDLRLVRYSRTDGAVPSLSAVTLATTTPAGGTFLVMVGYGRNRVENGATSASTPDAVSLTVGTGYHWDSNGVKRWGTNTVEAEFPNALELGGPFTGTTATVNVGGVASTAFSTDFDQPGGNQWLSSNEAQGSAGDSGGGAFYWDGTKWVLAGIFSTVSSYVGQDANSSSFGSYSVLTDVATYEDAIQSAIGTTLVPEPTVIALAGLGCIGFAVRRRR